MMLDTTVKGFTPFARLNHNCQTVRHPNFRLPSSHVLNAPTSKGKWLTILKSQWNQNPNVYPHFTVRTAFLIPLDSYKLILHRLGT